MAMMMRHPQAARDLVDERLKSFSPEQREHFKESTHHNRRVLKKLSKM
ncbi:MAG TPA: hypothetical protein PKK68_08690 [Methanothrix soehngenii]|nr:hypothetical protein [Methanothrix sp.]HNY34719.1 hypothetical protein [Methanothrix soehngenii]